MPARASASDIIDELMNAEAPAGFAPNSPYCMLPNGLLGEARKGFDVNWWFRASLRKAHGPFGSLFLIIYCRLGMPGTMETCSGLYLATNWFVNK